MLQLLALIPESLWILVIAGLGIGVILQIVRIKTALSIIVMFALISLLGPIIGSLLGCLPLWILILLMIVFAISIINLFVNVVFGRHTSSHFWAMLLHDLVKLPFRLAGSLIKRH